MQIQTIFPKKGKGEGKRDQPSSLSFAGTRSQSKTAKMEEVHQKGTSRKSAVR